MTPVPPSPSGGALSGVETAPRRGRWLWLLPALTFVAGLLLGAVIMGVGGAESAPPSAPDAAAGSPAPSDSGDAPEPGASPSDLLVRVPEPCLAVADEAEQAFTVFDAAVDAARRFDARRLQEVVDDVQQLRPRVQELADRCRDRTGQDLVEGSTATSVPTPTTGP